MPDCITNMIDTINGERGLLTNYLNHSTYTDLSATWLYILSTALSFQYEERDIYDKDLFGVEFGLNDTLVNIIMGVLEDEWNLMDPELKHEHPILAPFLNDIKRSWRHHPNDIEELMFHISNLALFVMNYLERYHFYHSPDSDSVRDDIKYFDDMVIYPLRYHLIRAAYWAVNFSDYDYDEVNKMKKHDVFVLYSFFDLYSHSIANAQEYPRQFEKSLRYRAHMDDHMYECLLQYTDMYDVLIPPLMEGPYAVEIMLEKMSPQVLASILKKIYPHQDTDGETFLHFLAKRHIPSFTQLFSHCTELWRTNNNRGLTPMAEIFSRRYLKERELNLLFDVVSHNSHYFALLC